MVSTKPVGVHLVPSSPWCHLRHRQAAFPESRLKDHGEGRCHHRHGHGDAVHHPPHPDPRNHTETTPSTAPAPAPMATLNGGGQSWNNQEHNGTEPFLHARARTTRSHTRRTRTRKLTPEEPHPWPIVTGYARMRRRKLSCWSTAPTPGTRENLAVEQQSWWWPGRGSAPGSAARMRQLTEARAAEPWLAAGSSSVQQQALRDFSHAMAAFFDPPNPAGKPSYRSKRGTQGFVIRDVTARRLNRNHAEVFVPKCGYVRFRLSRDLPADPGMARVTCDRSGRWHVAFGGPQPAVGRQPTGAVAGIDRGVRTALVT